MAAGQGANAIGGPNGSASQQVAVVPGDTAVSNFPSPTRGIYVGVAGDVNVLLIGDVAPVIWKNVPVGIMPVMATRVYSSSTTATNMVALF